MHSTAVSVCLKRLKILPEHCRLARHRLDKPICYHAIYSYTPVDAYSIHYPPGLPSEAGNIESTLSIAQQSMGPNPLLPPHTLLWKHDEACSGMLHGSWSEGGGCQTTFSLRLE